MNSAPGKVVRTRPATNFPSADAFDVWIVILVLWAVIAYSVVRSSGMDPSRARAPAAGEKYATFDVQPGGECNLDEVSVDGGDMTLSGWAILSGDADRAPPEPVLLELDVNGSTGRIAADRIERSDVAAAKNNDVLKMSGFTAVVKRQAGMLVTILQPSEGHLYECPDAFLADFVMAEKPEFGRDAPGDRD